METKRDTIILELIKYLVNSEKQLPQEMSRTVMYGSSESSGNAADVRELLRIQQQTNRKLDELKTASSLYMSKYAPSAATTATARTMSP